MVPKILIIDDLSTGKLKNLKDFSNNKNIEIIKKRVEDIDNLNTMFEKFDFGIHLQLGLECNTSWIMLVKLF